MDLLIWMVTLQMAVNAIYIDLDTPFDGIDANCDGEDGDHSLAVHVSASVGDDSFDGSLNFPVATIEQAISLAQVQQVLCSHCRWHICRKHDLVEGITYYGSMSESFDSRDTCKPHHNTKYNI